MAIWRFSHLHFFATLGKQTLVAFCRSPLEWPVIKLGLEVIFFSSIFSMLLYFHGPLLRNLFLLICAIYGYGVFFLSINCLYSVFNLPLRALFKCQSILRSLFLIVKLRRCCFFLYHEKEGTQPNRACRMKTMEAAGEKIGLMVDGDVLCLSGSLFLYSLLSFTCGCLAALSVFFSLDHSGHLF